MMTQVFPFASGYAVSKSQRSSIDVLKVPEGSPHAEGEGRVEGPLVAERDLVLVIAFQVVLELLGREAPLRLQGQRRGRILDQGRRAVVERVDVDLRPVRPDGQVGREGVVEAPVRGGQLRRAVPLDVPGDADPGLPLVLQLEGIAVLVEDGVSVVVADVLGVVPDADVHRQVRHDAPGVLCVEPEPVDVRDDRVAVGEVAGRPDCRWTSSSRSAGSRRSSPGRRGSRRGPASGSSRSRRACPPV